MTSQRSQRGATLVIGLIMLVLLTLLGLSAFNMSTSNFKVISNMQYQTEATTAAQAALNQVLSHGSYFLDPTTAPASLDVDINGSGGTYPVALTRPCLLAAVGVPLNQLSPLKPDDLKCMGSAGIKNSGIMGQQTGGAISNCSTVVWRITASVSDTLTRAKVQITEGAAVRMDNQLADAYKNDPARRCAS